MRGKRVVVAVAVSAGMWAAPATVLADFYDSFNDGHYWQNPNDEPFNPGVGYWPYYNTPDYDPNAWDIDNPHWAIFAVMGQNYLVDAGDGSIRFYAGIYFGTEYFMGAVAVTDDEDPNTSETYFDDSAPHYIVCNFRVWNPDQGQLVALLHADPVNWTGYAADLELMWHDGDPNDPNNDPNHHNQFMACHLNATNWNGRGHTFYPDLDTTERTWMVCQFDGDGDPNNSYIRVAVYNGDKYDDFDPNFDIVKHPLTDWDPNEYPYWGEGLCGVGNVGSRWGGSPVEIDAKFDDVECRWGTFTNVAHTLDLTVMNETYGTITIDPDLLTDPNHDPNSLAEQRRYTDGTEIVLVAAPIEGKAFKQWQIFDPNVPGDANYATADTNATLYLTMDQDWQVEAQFKCGSSMPLPLIAALLTLTACVIVRRLT